MNLSKRQLEQAKIISQAIKNGKLPVVADTLVLATAAAMLGKNCPPAWLKNDKIERGVFDLTWLKNIDQMAVASQSTSASSINNKAPKPSARQQPANNDENMDVSSKALEVLNSSEIKIPEKDNTYVPFGFASDLKKTIESEMFFPVYIQGESGIGKSFTPEQICARMKRKIVVVNITAETDEDDLIGGFRLINGHTVWHDGPVVQAMKQGAILVLDEIDYATTKIACIQSIIDGKGVFIKKLGVQVNHTKGFNIIATANTDGRGSSDGRYVGAMLLNEAFLERFAIMFRQDYPTQAVEEKILNKVCDSYYADRSNTFTQSLIDWASLVRHSFKQGDCPDVISTRRLVNIIKAASIFGEEDSVKKGIERFPEASREAFLNLYQSVTVYTKPDVKLEPDSVFDVVSPPSHLGVPSQSGQTTPNQTNPNNPTGRLSGVYFK